MGRELKTKGGEQKTSESIGTLRTLTGKLKVLNRSGNYLFPVELWMLNDLKNRNDWLYEGVEQSAKKFLGKPILTAYVGGKVGDGHNFRYEEDESGDPAPSFTGATDERIVGSISEDAGDVRTEKADGATWVVGIGTIFAWYAKEVVQKLREYAEQGREIPVSIETLVSKSRMENGVEIEEEYEILGVTILGDHVTPAVAGARIAALNSMGSKFRELKMRAASYAKEKTEQKGMSDLTKYTKKQCEALQERITGWKVLSAAEDENGLHIALRNDKYDLAKCDLTSADDPITDKKIVPCAALVDFGFGAVDVSDVLTAARDNETRLNESIAAKDATIAERDNQIKAMTDAENVRRVNAAKETAKETLAKFNANREEKIADSAIKEVCDKIEGGCYTAMTDEKGQWCGNKAVENDVYAVCAKSVMESDAAAKHRNSATFTYGRTGEKHNATGVADLLVRKGIRSE